MSFTYNPLREEDWLETEAGRLACRMEMDLVLRLLEPFKADRILDVGCGSGRHLLMFRQRGLDVTGVETSAQLLGRARERLSQAGYQVPLMHGLAEDLPFDDNEFDLVTLIDTLGFVNDPLQALGEAIRVARRRILIGGLNAYSLAGLGRRVGGLLGQSHLQPFGIWRLRKLVNGTLGPAPTRWGSVMLLPRRLCRITLPLEKRIPSMANPFGAFIGLAVDIVYRHRADSKPLKLRLRRREVAPGAAVMGATNLGRRARAA